MLKMLQPGPIVAILIVGLISQAESYNDQSSQSCRGDSIANPIINGISMPSVSVPSSSRPHSVKLSWNASIPASNSLGDAIQGYNMYRRNPDKKYEKINTDLIRGTSCVDYFVNTGQTYYYEIQAVSANGAVSKSSPEVTAVIPSR